MTIFESQIRHPLIAKFHSNRKIVKLAEFDKFRFSFSLRLE